MAKVLKVNSSGQKENSLTRKMVDKIAASLSTEAETIDRDVSDGLDFVNEKWIQANFTDPDQRSEEQKQTLKASDDLVQEVMDADHIVIGAPMYNFSVPATLKAWIDMIARARVTFKYTENGPVGLLKNKTAHIAMASGGVTLGSETDHSTPYLKQVMSFIGINDVKFYQAKDFDLS